MNNMNEANPGAACTALVRYGDLAVTVHDADNEPMLVNYDRMVAAIEGCVQIDEVQRIRNKAKALQEYHRQAQNTEAERKCAMIRLRAGHRQGELLKDMKKIGERDPGGRGPVEFRTGTQLADLGVGKKESAESQQLAAIPWETVKSIANAHLTKHLSVRAIVRRNREDEEKFREHVKARIFIPLLRQCGHCHRAWDGPKETCPFCGGVEVFDRPPNPRPHYTEQMKDWDKYIRMVQIFFDARGRREFDALETSLRARYKTRNITDTVAEAMRCAVMAPARAKDTEQRLLDGMAERLARDVYRRGTHQFEIWEIPPEGEVCFKATGTLTADEIAALSYRLQGFARAALNQISRLTQLAYPAVLEQFVAQQGNEYIPDFLLPKPPKKKQKRKEKTNTKRTPVTERAEREPPAERAERITYERAEREPHAVKGHRVWDGGTIQE